jgi:hypothetical protein
VSQHRGRNRTSVRAGIQYTFVTLLFAAALGWIAYTGRASIGHSGPVIHLPIWIRIPLGLATLGIIGYEATVLWMSRSSGTADRPDRPR